MPSRNAGPHSSKPAPSITAQEQKFDHFKVGIAVPVQRMVQSVTSGVIFTIEPITHDLSKIVIEAIYGLGEGLVSGEINPDLFIVSKEGPAILSRRISFQDRRLVRNTSGSGEAANYWQQVPAAKQEQQKLTDEEVIKLAELAIHIEKHYGMPQDIEWAKEDGAIYVVQSRPVTAIKEQAQEEEPEIKAPTILEGSPASSRPGLRSGQDPDGPN